jgi:hypothetical protein
MSIDKSKIRMAAQHELGVKFDDQLESARRAVNICEGAKQGLSEARSKIDTLNAVWKQTATDDFLNELAAKGPLAISAEVIKWINRAAGVCVSLCDVTDINAHVIRGKVQALESVLKITKQAYDAAHAQAERIEAIEAGTEPSLSAAQDIEARRAEARKRKKPITETLEVGHVANT